MIRKNDRTVVESFFQVKTDKSTFQLHQEQKDFCTNYSMRISTKNTEMVHTKRLSCIIGPNVQLAASEICANQINNKAGFDPNMIEIKKRFTYEKGTSSKVLMIYAVQDEASAIDNAMFNAEFDRFQHVSYKLSTSSQQLGAMHLNEMINIKS